MLFMVMSCLVCYSHSSDDSHAAKIIFFGYKNKSTLSRSWRASCPQGNNMTQHTSSSRDITQHQGSYLGGKVQGSVEGWVLTLLSSHNCKVSQRPNDSTTIFSPRNSTEVILEKLSCKEIPSNALQQSHLSAASPLLWANSAGAVCNRGNNLHAGTWSGCHSSGQFPSGYENVLEWDISNGYRIRWIDQNTLTCRL